MGGNDYKIEYITNQLKKSFGNNKKYECYCVTRIYHLLNRDDIQIVTQKLLYSEEKEKAFADLYFPQINVWIEIDEDYNKNQKKAEKKRTLKAIEKEKELKYLLEEAISIKKLEKPYRIDVSSDDISYINEQIDTVVKKLQDKIDAMESAGTFYTWEGANIDPSFFIKKGIINSSDNDLFKTIKDVSDLFNKDYKDKARIAYFNARNKEDSNEYVWCLKLSLNDNDYDNIRYLNTISYDGKTIYERDKNNNDVFYKYALENMTSDIRYVFVKYKHPDGIDGYKFKGVYKLDSEKTNSDKVRTWIKISDKIDLQSFFEED